MIMPGETHEGAPPNESYFGKNLESAILNGKVQIKELDEMVKRILGAWVKMRQDQGFPLPNFSSWNRTLGAHIKAETLGHRKLIREIGGASTILVKNKDGTLPILPFESKGGDAAKDLKVKKIAVLGEDARAPRVLNGFP
jgi:beta-glucosidase